MGFGLALYNDSNELVISSDAKMLHCLGKATLESIVQVSGNAEGGKTTGRRAGYSTYILNLPADQTSFALAIAAPVNRAVGILNLQWLAPGQYRITAYCGTNAYDSYGFDTVQEAAEIWAFGFVNSLANNFGLALYDKNGALSADFSRPNPLYPRFIGDFTGVSSQTIPSLYKPVILGGAGYFTSDIYDRPDGYLYNYIEEVKFWNRTSATTLTTAIRRLKYYGCNELNDAPDYPDGSGRGIAIVMEGLLLP